MTTGATGQLGLALPVQGELSGTWGDTVNNGITQYTNIAIAGTLTLTGDGAVTLANTTGDASASNITSTLTGAGTVTAQFAIVRVTGTLTVAKVVTGPAYSKTYTVVNAATGGIVTFKASGQTGVSVAVGESAFVYFNGTDYVKLVGTATAGAAGGSNTQVQFNSSGVLAGSANMTFDGTSLTLANGASIQGLTVGRGAGAVATNTAVGASALAANTTGIVNVAVGRLALQANTTGGYNTATGNGALYSNISGSNNSAFGEESLFLNTTESNNTAVGYQAGYNNVGGDYLTVVGSQAGKGNTSGRFNTAVGRDALLTNSTSNDNTAVGTNALKLTTAAGNTALGSNALGVATTGASNVGVGNAVLARHTTGSYNVGVGVDALSFNTTASYNTAVGNSCFSTNTASSNNTGLGARAGRDTTGNNNVFIGGDAGLTVSTGAGNTYVGYGAGPNSFAATGTINTTLGYLSGNAITTGSKNTIIGAYTGNQGGLDIRTSSNYIVLSDGDGNPNAYINGSGTLTVTTATASIVKSGAVTTLTMTTGDAFSLSTSLGVIALDSGGSGLALRMNDGGYYLPFTFAKNGVMSVGGATASTSGAGITFPATQSASSNANTLDDYEEGTFTPNQGSGLTIGGTFTSSGIYTKIGNLVTVNFRVGGSVSVACSSSGEITTNLPFTVAASPGNAMGSIQNSNGVLSGAYGYTTTVTNSTTALSTAGAIFVTITYQV